jgi:hypothetical protein
LADPCAGKAKNASVQDRNESLARLRAVSANCRKDDLAERIRALKESKSWALNTATNRQLMKILEVAKRSDQP